MCFFTLLVSPQPFSLLPKFSSANAVWSLRDPFSVSSFHNIRFQSAECLLLSSCNYSLVVNQLASLTVNSTKYCTRLTVKPDSCDVGRTDWGSECWFIPAVPPPLPSAHFRLLLYLAAVQNILVLLQWLSVRGAQRTYTDRYTHTDTHIHIPIFYRLLYFPIPPSRKMRSLHSWRLLLLTEQMGQSRQLAHHTATVAAYSWARHSGKTTQALPYGFPVHSLQGLIQLPKCVLVLGTRH